MFSGDSMDLLQFSKEQEGYAGYFRHKIPHPTHNLIII